MAIWGGLKRAFTGVAALAALALAGCATAQDVPPPPPPPPPVSPPPPPPPPPPTDVRIADARALAEAGDLVGAEIAFLRIAQAADFRGDARAAAEAWVETAKVRLALRREPDADAAIGQALDVLEAAFGPASPELAPTLLTQARMRYIQGRHEEALAVADRGLSLTADPRSREDLTLIADLTYERGKNLDALGRFADAEEAARTVIALRTDLLGADDPYVGDALNQLANALMAQGRFAEAEPHQRRALVIYEAVYGGEDAQVALALSNLGNILRRTGRMEEAERSHRRAVAIAQGVDDPVLLAQTLTNHGWLLHLTGRGDLAEPIFRQALALALDIVGPDHPFTGVATANLAFSLVDQGRHAEALPLFQTALPVLEAGLGADSPDLVTTLDGYGQALIGLNRPAEAEALMVRSAAILAARQPAGHPDAVFQAANHGGFLAGAGRPGEALAVLRPARDALFRRDGRRLEGGDPTRRAAPLFRRLVQAAWLAKSPD
ncbi:MAG TPA: tetratricopeptide repeat protein [Brevundimonas sp.]|jgi:tetratricopeptide (TPR) repeat protein|uniref:tetratricopeptide repeat protein n=1 Tax=Brevundimonas sp. TaxID=1871086 RepID=UPI002DE9553F|nr:tetratricopeptide repeat protein [Brevundimonas sp.]